MNPSVKSAALLSLLLSSSIAWAEAATDAQATPSFDYLYILSNEGGSSGGHTAIRFGRDVYHFQSENGLLVIHRDLADAFLYDYALLGNRTIHATRVAVSKETLSTLVNRFRQRHRAQEAQIGVADALREDRLLLQIIHDLGTDPSNSAETFRLAVLGLGYFEPQPPQAERAENEAAVALPSVPLVSLTHAIVRTHGSDFLSNRRRRLLDEMQTLGDQDPTAWAVEPPVSVYAYPPFARSYSSRWHDLAAGLAALDVLEDARPLAPTTHHAPRDAYFELGPQEIQAFERYSRVLAEQLVGLLESRRGDWGQTLLVGMARLSALAESVETGRLVFLDAFPEASRTLDGNEINRSGDTVSNMLLENQAQLDGARTFFAKSTAPNELAWERLEERSNRYLEILRAVRDDAPMRVARGHLVPSREAPYPLPSLALRRATDSSKDLERARQRERSYSRELYRLHRYNLITQNCATALFATINASFGDSAELSQEQLGGYVRSRNSLAFIPFVSARQVNERYAVITREIIPSYRERRIQTMRSHESSFRVALRESNTFTATTYERSPADSFFVFFTEDRPLLRPILGAVNLVAALGQSVLGIITAPVDRGHNLQRGLRGAFVSLPELAFANIRKGSNDWIPMKHRSLAPIAEATGPGR